MASPRTISIAVAVIALIVASAAAWLVHGFLKKKETETERAKLAVQEIVVAAKDIPFGTTVMEPDLKMERWPKGTLPKGWFAAPKAASGRLAVAAIPAGSPVLEASLAPAGTGGVMSYILAPGMRAMTVAVNDVVGVAGFLLPNSVVDVVATVTSPQPEEDGGACRVSKIIIQNKKVLAVGQVLEQKEGKPMMAPTVTLEVRPEEAEKLALASENKVQLVLKHLDDKTEVKTAGATVVSLLDMPPRRAALPARSVRAQAAPAPEETRPHRVVEVIKGTARTQEKFY